MRIQIKCFALEFFFKAKDVICLYLGIGRFHNNCLLSYRFDVWMSRGIYFSVYSINNVSLNIHVLFVIIVKGLNLPPLVLETRMLPHQQDTCEKQDLSIEPNSCFSDSTDSNNLLNSMKVLLRFGKSQFVFVSCRPLYHTQTGPAAPCHTQYAGKLVLINLGF